jgi:hypothetical protein
MIRLVLTTNLVVLFSIAAISYAAAQDCSGRFASCNANCRGMPYAFQAGCTHNCWNEKNACDRTVERQRTNERVEEQRREEERRRQGRCITNGQSRCW